MTQNNTAEEIRDLTSAEFVETSGGNIALILSACSLAARA